MKLKKEKRGKGQRRVEEMGVKRGKIRGMNAKGKGWKDREIKRERDTGEELTYVGECWVRQLICTSLCAAVVVTGFKCTGASSPPPSLTTSAALRVSKSIFFFSRGFILDCIAGCNLFHCCCKHAPHALLPRHVFTLSLTQGYTN